MKIAKFKTKITVLLLLFLFTLDIFSKGMGVKAETYKYGTVDGYSVQVKEGPASFYNSIDTLSMGQEVTILSTSNGWYQIQFKVMEGQTKSGWVPRDYIDINMELVDPSADPVFEAYLNEQGFPESYRTYLRSLHALFPDWKFKALKTNLDWNTVINQELSVVYRNLIPAGSADSWKSTEPGAYDWNTGVWVEFEDGWVAASKEIVAYYMDPRNFIRNNTDIFQFYTLSYTGEETEEGLANILNGTFMASSETVKQKYIGYFMEAAKISGVSPYFLASRSVQEVTRPGGGYSGSVEGPYYNFYNIGATGVDPIAAAVAYAKAQGWSSPKIAIIEGAKWISKGYIDSGQDTLYLQKFDVIDGGNGYYWHQYMTNVMAPTSEASKLAKAHPNYEASEIIFTIPVYKNMPAALSAKPKSSGNPNNLLKSLKVIGYQLTPVFDKFTTEYSVIVSEDVSEVTIHAEAVMNVTSVTGDGTRILDYGHNEIRITATAENGTKKVYVLHIERKPFEENSQDPSTGLTSDVYSIADYITGVAPMTSAEDFKKHLRIDDGVIRVTDKTGAVSTGNIGTGSVVQVLKDNQLIKSYPVVLYGDISGDGKISIIDLALIQQHILKVNTLTGVQEKAGDTNRSGGISIVDLALVQRHILNVSSISQ